MNLASDMLGKSADLCTVSLLLYLMVSKTVFTRLRVTGISSDIFFSFQLPNIEI